MLLFAAAARLRPPTPNAHHKANNDCERDGKVHGIRIAVVPVEVVHVGQRAPFVLVESIAGDALAAHLAALGVVPFECTRIGTFGVVVVARQRHAMLGAIVVGGEHIPERTPTMPAQAHPSLRAVFVLMALDRFVAWGPVRWASIERHNQSTPHNPPPQHPGRGETQYVDSVYAGFTPKAKV